MDGTGARAQSTSGRCPARVIAFTALLGSIITADAQKAGDASLDDLNLPPAFRQKVEDRKVIDLHQAIAYPTEPVAGPAPIQPAPKRMSERRGVIRPLHTQVSGPALEYRTSFPDKFIPLRGYRAPLLNEATNEWPALLPAGSTRELAAAAGIVQRRLAPDGLLATAVACIVALDPARFETNTAAIAGELRRAGFPVDLLSFFNHAAASGERGEDRALLSFIVQQLLAGASLEALRDALATAAFQFRKSAPSFEAMTESGEHPLAFARMQIGGGYKDGIVPGGSLDFAEQLITAVPDLKLIVSIEREFFNAVRGYAGKSWPLRRLNQLTLIAEPMNVSAWAQDNGKGGVLRASGPQPATLVPRYASIGEGESMFVPGESFLMDGVQAAGVSVIQSPLLFQGGNAIVVRDPAKDERVLLLSQGEITRNTALGLTTDQVLRAFQIEFGVDRCLVVPAASYHLDYDISARGQDARLVMFSNDPLAAARIVVQLGIDALQRHGFLARQEADAARRDLFRGEHARLVNSLTKVLDRFRNPEGAFQSRLARCFAVDSIDSASANLRCFCVALDFLAAGSQREVPDPLPQERIDYLAALERMLESIDEQRAVMEAQGWIVVPVPSMPEMKWGINYLNGVQERTRYLMPAYGGFYAPLDEAAADAFAGAFEASVAVVPLLCAESQRNHGAIHCMVSLLPPPAP